MPIRTQHESSPTYSFASEEANTIFVRALEDRHAGRYQAAVSALELLVESEGDSEHLWVELALTQFHLWEAHVRGLHLPAILELSAASSRPPPRVMADDEVPTPLHVTLLQETYSTFLIAMEYPESKKNPALLLPLVRLYLEFGSYRGALSVCTLLVEGYPTSPRLGEAIFLSALTAAALERHRESAQYFRYLAERPGPPSSLPLRLAAYQFYLLSALELARVPGLRAHEREAYAQAYTAMIALPPALPSEKSAHTLYATSHKNAEQRTLLWIRDAQTWIDLARRLAGPANAPLLILLALHEARRRSSTDSERLATSLLLLEGASLLRMGHREAAQASLEEALLQLPRETYYCARHERFLLESSSKPWRLRFALEHRSALRLQLLQRRRRRLAKWRMGVAGVLQQRREAMATRIQCAWRSRVARQELQRLREQQRQREIVANTFMATQDDRVIELKLHAAARRIQSLLHISRAKRTLRSLRAAKVEREALLARFAGRRAELGCHGAFKRWRMLTAARKRECLEAAVLIQRQFRAWRSRRMCHQLVQLRRRQERVLGLCLQQRATSLRTRVLTAWRGFARLSRQEREQAVTRVQRLFRSRCAVRRYRMELLRHQAAIATMHQLLAGRRQQKLMSCWRALAGHALARRELKRGAAVCIQRRTRGILARRVVKRLRARRRRVMQALLVLAQTLEKLLLAGGLVALWRHAEAQRCRMIWTVARIQALFRSFRARQRVRSRRAAQALLDGDIVFCSGIRGQPAGVVLCVSFLALQRHVAHHQEVATRLQQWWRRAHPRRRLIRALGKRAAQRRLLGRLQRDLHTQARAFLHQLREACVARKTRQHAAASRIQRSLRGWLLRRRYLARRRLLSVAESRGLQAAEKLAKQRLQRQLQGWRRAMREAKAERREAARLLQHIFRARRAQRQARQVVAKRAAQARLLSEATQKPLERWFRRWEATTLIEKSVLQVRGACAGSGSLPGSREATPPSPSSWLSSPSRTVSAAGQRKLEPALNYFDKPATLEERSEVPPMLFFTLLNRVRRSGLCQLSYSGGTFFKPPQLRQLVSLASSVLVDGGGVHSSDNDAPLNLVEQVVDALNWCTSSSASAVACPVQKLVLCNASLRSEHALQLAGIVARSRRSCGVMLVSLVLANVPLALAAVRALACALAQSPACLQQLVLERCQVGSAGAAALAEALAHNRALRKLDLSGNHVADAACAALARALLAGGASGSELRVLVLSRNDLSDRGVLAFLAPALQLASASRLEQLVLRHNPRVTARGFEALQQAAQRPDGSPCTPFSSPLASAASWSSSSWSSSNCQVVCVIGDNPS